MNRTEELLNEVAGMQRKLKMASLEGARMVIRKLAQGDWGHKERKELENMAAAIRWAIDEMNEKQE